MIGAMMTTMAPNAPTDDALADAVRGRLLAAGVEPVRAAAVVDGAPCGWWEAPAEDLVVDALLVAPGLRPGEVRVRVASPAPGDHDWELSVVAPDRPGLLSRTATVCTAHRVSIRSARVASWPGLALQRLRVRPLDVPLSGEPDWTSLGQALRGALTAAHDDPVDIAVDPAIEFRIEAVDDLGDGTHRVRVSGDDRLGLLAMITRTLWAAGGDIRSAELHDEDGRVLDTFVVAGVRPEWLAGAETPPE
jgi:hypothetical protein